MGDKLAARQIAHDAGVPPVPGAMFAVDEPDAVRRFGDELGWPLAVKAVHGGGGRGMRVIGGPGEVAESLAAARRESQSSFGRPEVYVERFLARPRHVEVQIVADHHGGLVVVGDRDCSIQRRYQKLIEEAPAPRLPDAVRAGLAEAATRLARAVGYTNAGTIEFLVDGEEFFFLEMNTRIQVEHPVTELVTGVDLVAEQLRIAGGDALSFGPDDVAPTGRGDRGARQRRGHHRRTLPAGAGDAAPLRAADGPHVRVDTGFRTGDVLPAEYDNLIAKIAVWGADREEARRRTLDALDELARRRRADHRSRAAAVLAHDDFRAVATRPAGWPTTAPTCWRRSERRQPPTSLTAADPVRRPRSRCSAGGTASPASATPRAERGPTTSGGDRDGRTGAARAGSTATGAPATGVSRRRCRAR